jgi:hypothetical protein
MELLFLRDVNLNNTKENFHFSFYIRQTFKFNWQLDTDEKPNSAFSSHAFRRVPIHAHNESQQNENGKKYFVCVGVKNDTNGRNKISSSKKNQSIASAEQVNTNTIYARIESTKKKDDEEEY